MCGHAADGSDGRVARHVQPITAQHADSPVAVTSLSPRAFVMLLLLAAMFGGNHVAARFAFNDGVDVATAVTLRSGVTALIVGALVWQQRVA